jgi:hypothetical protein
LPRLAWFSRWQLERTHSKPPSDTKPPIPRWDASGGFGLHYLHSRELGETYNSWETKGQLRFRLGRYFTPHLKTELAVSGPTGYGLYETEQFPVAGLPNGGFASTRQTFRLVALTPAFTYQFFENSFAYPFLSGGLNVGMLNEHRHRDQTTYRESGISYTVGPVDSRRTTVLLRPFVAGGFKSYFNDRTFVRPEIQTAFGSSGAPQVALRLDFGFDF